MNKFFALIIFYSPFFLSAQDTLMPVIFLDDIIISEENNGFTINDFVGYVKNDTTFYKGFKHLRYYTHNYESELNIFNKKGSSIGTIRKWGVHYSSRDKCWIITDSIYSDGKIFKRNGNHRYYTPKAFDEVFFPNDSTEISLNISNDKNNSDSKNMRDAKTVGFSVGSDNTEQKKGGISKKLAVFDVDMQQYYNYTISDTIYNGRNCYVFTVKVKEELKNRELNKTLIRNLVSFFDKENFHVIYREYKLLYKNWFINLDIDIKVHMDYVNNRHIPTHIYYNGFWNALLFKHERAEFYLRNFNYIVE